MKLDKWTTIERDGEEIEINVEADASPMIPATYWQPEEGGEIEITAVFRDGVAFELTDAEAGKIVDWLGENLGDDFDDGPDPDDWRDARINDRLTNGDVS
jgi:hypothetical protein